MTVHSAQAPTAGITSAAACVPESDAECDDAILASLHALIDDFGPANAWLAINRDSALIPLLRVADDPLIQALLRFPEKRDGRTHADGPAAASLRSLSTVRQRADDRGLAPWSDALAESGISEVLAHPCIVGPDQRAIVCIARYGGHLGKRAIRDFGSFAESIGECFRRIQRHRLRLLLEAGLNQSGLGSFLTDARGRILWLNPAFASMSGFDQHVAIGATPRMLNSGRQSKAYYQRFWNAIGSGQHWSEEIVERRSDGDTYRVRQNVTPIRRNQRIDHFLAFHEDIGDAHHRRQRAEQRSGTDPVTGLLNECTMLEAIRQRRVSGNGGQLSLIAIHGLLEFRHVLGIDLIDSVLAQVGEQIREVFSGHLPIAHLGDARFLLLMGDDTPPDVLRQRVADLVKSLRQPFLGIGEGLRLRVRFGVVGLDAGPTEPERLIVAADNAAVEMA